MTSTTTLPSRPAADPTRDRTLIWIDAREALIGHWHRGEITIERLHSDVPSRHRAMGHIRRDPTVRHGGGAAQDAAEANRLEHLARFIDLVATRIPLEGDVLVLGPGTVRDRLGHRLHETERLGVEGHEIAVATAGRLTEPQFVARLRHLAGADPRRRTAGAPRRSPSRTAGGADRSSRRPVMPPPIELDD
jgi:hypothetical protein